MEVGCDKAATAYHEAGHIVVAHNFGEAEFAKLLNEEENCGHTKYRHKLEEIEQESCVLMLLAGPLAELLYRKRRTKSLTD